MTKIGHCQNTVSCYSYARNYSFFDIKQKGSIFGRTFFVFMKAVLTILLLSIPYFKCFAQHPTKSIYTLRIDSFEIQPITEVAFNLSANYGNRCYFLNFRTNSLDYYDFQLRKHGTLYPVGEGLMNITTGIGVFKTDTVTFLTFNGIATYDTKGNLLEEKKFIKKYAYDSNINSNYSSLKHTPYGYLYETSTKKSEIALFNPAKNKITPIVSNNNVQGKGMLHHIYYDLNNTRLAFVHEYSPELIQYDLTNKSKITSQAKSSFDSGFIDLPDKSDEAENIKTHWVINGFYHKLIYHKILNKWILFYYHPQPYKDINGKQNQVYSGRTTSLLILNDNLNVEEEYVIPPYFSIYLRVYCYSDGIIVRKTNYENNRQYMSPILFYHISLK